MNRQSLCSGFVDKTLSWGFWKLFRTGTYAIIGTTCVEFENVMKSTTKKGYFTDLKTKAAQITRNKLNYINLDG